MCESLLQCEYTEKQRMEDFEERITGDAPTAKFFDPIPRVAIKTFKDAALRTTNQVQDRDKS